LKDAFTGEQPGFRAHAVIGRIPPDATICCDDTMARDHEWVSIGSHHAPNSSRGSRPTDSFSQLPVRNSGTPGNLPAFEQNLRLEFCSLPHPDRDVVETGSLPLGIPGELLASKLHFRTGDRDDFAIMTLNILREIAYAAAILNAKQDIALPGQKYWTQIGIEKLAFQRSAHDRLLLTGRPSKWEQRCRN